MKKNITKMIYTDNPFDFNEEEIRQILIETETTEDPSTDECWDWWYEEKDIEWNDVSYEMQRCTGSFVIVGTLGLWNGKFKGSCLIRGDLLEAIQKCLEDYNQIYMYNKQLHVDAIHHDGINKFVIKKLTKKGEDYFEEHDWEYSNADINQILFQNSHYSHHIDHFSKLYGWYGCNDN